MPINSYDHFTIRCADLDKSWAFYQDVLGVRVEAREPPAGATSTEAFPRAAIGYFDNGEWFVHLFQATPEQDAMFARMAPRDEDMAKWQTGRMHHVAVHATGYAEIMGRLQQHNVPCREFRFGERLIVQFQDPDGIEIELAFAASEAG